jgi:hypothetical protein
VPLLPAAGYSVPQAPSVNPAPDAGTPYQSSAAATPAAFGAATGEAFTRLSSQAEAAAQHTANIQSMLNETAANDQSNQAQDRINKVVYGDPDKPGDVGFYGLRGDAAMREYPNARRQIDQILTEHRGSLQNLPQQQQFDQASRTYRNYMLGQIGRHYDQQFHEYQSEEAKANAVLNSGKVAGAAAQGDQEAFETFVSSSIKDAQDRGARLNLPPEAVEANKQAIQRHALKSWADGLAARGDAVAADAFVDRNKDIAGDQYEPLKREFHARAKEQQINNAVYGGPVMPGPSSGPLVRGDALEKFLDLTVQHESGGRNIMQQAVPAGGGYNPSTGTVTGPSTAQGFYQITNSTWNAYAPKAGVDTSKYPTAMTAPADVQRQVARQIASTGGVQNWTSYNPALKAAAANAGLPVTGTLSGGAAAQASAPPPPPDPTMRPDSAVPGLQAKLADIDQRAKAEGWPADVYRGAYNLARERLNAAYTDEQRQRQADHVANEKLVQSAENEIIADHYTDQPKITAAQVSVDPRFNADPQARMRMLALLKPDRTAVDPVTSSNTMHDLMRQISAGEVTDRAPILDAFNAQPGRLNESHFNFLMKQVDDVRTPEGLKISKDIDNLIAAVKPSITKSNPLMGSLDPSGDLQLGAFTEEVRRTVELMRKGGAKPGEIADYLSVKRYRDNPELLEPYQKSISQSSSDIARQMSRPPSAPPPPSAPVVTQPNPFGASAAPASSSMPNILKPTMAPSEEFTAPIPPAPSTAPPVAPRKPGESAADYMKRIGSGMPR